MSDEKSTKPLFELLGGHETLRKVHKIFYDKIYAHPWIGKFFAEIKQNIIEDQQTDFMAQIMGGPKNYKGKFPIPAHKHMMITEDLFELRKSLLIESLNEAKIPKDLQEAWLNLDNAFKKSIVKSKVEDCEKRYNTDVILDFPNPTKKAS